MRQSKRQRACTAVVSKIKVAYLMMTSPWGKGILSYLKVVWKIPSIDPLIGIFRDHWVHCYAQLNLIDTLFLQNKIISSPSNLVPEII